MIITVVSLSDSLTLPNVEAEERPGAEEESETEEDDTLISRLFEELEAMRQRVSCGGLYCSQCNHIITLFAGALSGSRQKLDAQLWRPKLGNQLCKKWRSA